MAEASRRPRRFVDGWLAVAALCVLFAAVNGRWGWLYRHGQPWDIDEAGYLSIALVDAQALAHGVLAWVRAVEAPSIQAPLTTALASLVLFAVGAHPVASLAVSIAAGIVTIIGAAALARTIASPGSGLATACLVASCPTVVDYARTFFFALPATAVFTVAVLSLTRSNGFQRLGWALAFGVSVGLLPLARTMTIAFIPGLLAAAGIAWLAGRDRWAARAGRLVLALVVAGLTAATWLALNGALVFGYLFSFGYGARSGEFGPGGATDWASAAHYMLRVLVNSLHLPHALVVAVAVVLAPVLFGRVVRRLGWRGAAVAALRSPLLPALIALIEMLAALTSSPNKGSAFDAPALPILLVLAVATIDRVLRGPVRALAAAACATICIATGLTLIGLSPVLAAPWTVDVPGLGPVLLFDGRGTIQTYEAQAGYDDGPAQPLDTAAGRAWIAATDALSAALGRQPAAFGFRHYLLNVNTVRLQSLLSGAEPGRLVQVEPFVTGDTVEGYRQWLTSGEAAGMCRLVTMAGPAHHYAPPVALATMVAAAEAAGFEAVDQLPTPDGVPVSIWRRSGPGCP